MNALGDAVVGDDEAVEHRDVVEQPARLGRGRDPPQARDVTLARHRLSAIAARGP